MRRISCFLVLVVLGAFMFAGMANSQAIMKLHSSPKVTDLVVGTSAVNDTAAVLDIRNYDYIAAEIEVDVSSGGNSGGATIYFEGSVDTLTWTKLYFVEYSDSCLVDNTLTISSTADLKFTAILTPIPYDLTNAYKTWDGFLPAWTPLPFTTIRAIVVDTNWNAAAGVDIFYVVRTRAK